MAEMDSRVRDLVVAARVTGRALWRRWSGKDAALPDPAHWRAKLEGWLHNLPDGVLLGHRFVDLPATRRPWTPSGLAVSAGQQVTWFATGRVYLSRALDLWVDPSFQLWGRVGDQGTVFRGTRATHTFTAATEGPVHLASYFPGEWSTPQGALGRGAEEYDKVSGGMTALVLAWRPGIDVGKVLADAAEHPNAPVAVRAEAQRLAQNAGPPEGWEYLWFLGPAEIYRPSRDADGEPTIDCVTHGDVGILRREARVPLEAGTFLHWRWRVERLPADLREDSLPTHDYLSLAVEFDDGQDLTYYWSAELPPGTVYRCPLPAWHDRETHVVVRSGPRELGRWLEETRDVHQDYRRCIGGKARSVVRVWLIANSLFQRGHGRCEYARIEFTRLDGSRIPVL
jgi:hypothetical protein